MLKYAIIVAAGSGNRMNSSVPKQFLPLKGKPVLLHTIETFLSSFDDIQLVIVLPERHFVERRTVEEAVSSKERIQFATGGTTRFHSVKNGLKVVPENSIVFVHDAVR